MRLNGLSERMRTMRSRLMSRYLRRQLLPSSAGFLLVAAAAFSGLSCSQNSDQAQLHEPPPVPAEESPTSGDTTTHPAHDSRLDRIP